ncbi:unnamed protein product [Thelazia callipaeda]|uniref:MFS domain-containing protein n=1 Tax=Thelazia callipaeda TaxID=103827 RepID=A0A0N5CPF5_THECL|nr:unnamed protein product [Thelazia callipaeda]
MAQPILIHIGDNNDIKIDEDDFRVINKHEQSDSETDWPSVRLISAIIFFGMIQMSVIGMSEWPYMKEIDPFATSTFFGLVISVSSLGHAICAPLMGYWSSAINRTKPPLVAGRLIALFGCLLYLCLEFFSSGRRYIMLFCYTIFGISMSSVSVMRGYVARISTLKDRAMAVSLFGLAIMLAIAVGPVFQLLFTSLKYPGLNLAANKLLLNIYTGPIYVATCSNIISLILIVCFFKDRDCILHEKSEIVCKSPNRKNTLLTDLYSFDLSLAISCILVRMIATLSITIIHTTSSPLMMSVFDWSSIKTVRVGSYTQAIVGFFSMLIYIGFASGKFTKIISERCGALVAIVLFALFYLLTYPWSFFSGVISIREEENMTGCDANIYKWCLTSYAVSPVIYIGSAISVLGIAYTLVVITIDTLYSKILGNIDQSVMQGVFLFAQDIINVCGPIIIALVLLPCLLALINIVKPSFTKWGQNYIWMATEVIIIAVCIRWIIVYKELPKTATVLGKWLSEEHKRTCICVRIA